ncbi:hypothetical protein NA78x_000148 [Anatilimnocola sp. NA78]|uniref:hypothetical protein n=1 Tax=Anatilimnocola sp. NA78 TaxID=3415683 RepID=UPI003CE5BB4D
MNQSYAPSGAMMVGLALMFIGYWFQSALPVQTVWTNEQALEYGQNSARLHTATYGKEHDHSKPHSHSEPNLKDKEYIEAKAAFEKSVQARDNAISRLSWIKYSIVATGVIVAGWGVLQVMFEKMKNDDRPRHVSKPKRAEHKHQHH